MLSKWVNDFNSNMDSLGDRLRDKEIRVPIDLTAGIVAILFSLFIFAVMPDQVAISEKDVVNGRAFPTLLMSVMLICGIVLVGREILKLMRKQPLEWKVINVQTEAKALVIFVILFFTYFLSRLTGLFVIGAVFCCIGFLLYFRCRKKSYYALTITLAVIIWAVFRFVLNVDF